MKTYTSTAIVTGLGLAVVLGAAASAAVSEPNPPTKAQTDSHLDLQIPVYLQVKSASCYPLGQPVSKIRVEVSLRAREHLYSPVEAAVGETTRRLQCITRAGSETALFNIDMTATWDKDTWRFGSISSNYYARLGAPESAFPVGWIIVPPPAASTNQAQQATPPEVKPRGVTIQDVITAVDSLADAAGKWRGVIEGGAGPAKSLPPGGEAAPAKPQNKGKPKPESPQPARPGQALRPLFGIK